MTEYMTAVFAISAILSLLSHISYPSAAEGARRLAFGVILLSVVAAPAFDALDRISQGDFAPPETPVIDADSSKLMKDAFEAGIAAAVSEKFQLRACDIQVITEGFVPEEWVCEKIRIILSGSAITGDLGQIERYINRLEIGKCEVEIEIG